MLFCIWLILQVGLGLYVSNVYCEGCGDFYFGSSHYEANFVEVENYNYFKTWIEIKDICEQSGYQLVSITTSNENDAIIDFLLENCVHGYYAIGLSRQMGMPRGTWASWNWESGETIMDPESWDSGEPNVANDNCAAVYMTTIGSYKWSDFGCDQSFGSYGYICEKSMITTPQLSTAGETGDTTVQSPTSGTQSSSTIMTSLSTTVIDETMEVQYGISDAPITNSSSDYEYNYEPTTPQLSTAAGETTQSSTSGTQSSSTNHVMTSLSSTVIGETTEVQYGISDVPITNASSDHEYNYEPDLIVILLASVSPVAAIVVLLLLYKFRERLCCKPKSKTNPDLMMDIIQDKPMTCGTLINSTENECCDIDSANKGSIYYNIVLENDRPGISTANTTGQGKNPGSNNIQVQSMNTSSDNSRAVYTYHVIQSASTQDREHPHDYESEENPNYDRYQKEEMGFIYTEITNESEDEVNNPAYDALPFETEINYASLDKTTDVVVSLSGDVKEASAIVTHVNDNGIGRVDDSNIDTLYAKPDMNKRRRHEVQSPDDNTLPSETESNYASPDKTTDVVVSGDVKEAGAIAAPVDDNGGLVDDSNIDDLYAKPDMNKRHRYEVQSPDNNTLSSETESNYASPDKTTDVVVSGDALKGTGVIVAPVDDNDKISDSNIDALYAEPDKNKIRTYQVQSPDNNTLTSETESSYASPDKTTDVVVSGDALKES